MADAAHEPEATQLDIAGYRSCRNEHCGGLILLEVSQRTKGLCVDCFRGELGASLAEIEVRNHGRAQRMQIPRRSKPEPRKGNAWTHHASSRARAKADKRLRQLFRDLYDVLLAEERARFGLDPFPLETAVNEPSDGDASETIAFAAIYASLDQHGVDLDGLEIPPAN